MFKYSIISIIAFVFLSGCVDKSSIDYRYGDIRLFEPIAWDLAKAVRDEDIKTVSNIIEEGKVSVDIRERKYGETLLIWAVENRKFKSAEVLLRNGANPNLFTTTDPHSAIIASASNDETTEFLNLILHYGGDPNNRVDSPTVLDPTPLMAAARTNIKNVQVLINAGGEINLTISKYSTALRSATIANKIDVVKYLLLDKKADFNIPMQEILTGGKAYVVDFMRLWTFPLESPEYKTKMEIVDFLKKKGMNYWDTKVPDQLYKNYDAEYLKKY